MEVDYDSVSSNGTSASRPVSLRHNDSNAKPEDTFKILIASDIHLGVHEKDQIRCRDSFNTFEEILSTAGEKDVDFILLGGDLFHESKPSSKCFIDAMTLMRQYTMGDKPISMAFENEDIKQLFQNSVIEDVNYQDPNQNFSYPIFSIHGNHDDPSGMSRTSAVGVISSSGLLNYFGVSEDLTNITIKPLLFRKGRSKLALYGISHIRDERLSRLMATGAVKFILPKRNPDSWFKVLVLHQNRVPRPGTKHIEEKWIPDYIDVVIWGHEHDCRITPEPSQEPDKHFYIIQPGSPVATSLSESEAIEKKIGVLNVHSKQFYLDEIKLKTVRPFIFHTEDTSNWVNVDLKKKNAFSDAVKKFIQSKLLKAAAALKTGHSNQPSLPLIRLRLELDTPDHKFNHMRFGQQFFTDIVANPSDMLMFKMPFTERGPRRVNQLLDDAELEELLDTSAIKAETLIPKYFEEDAQRGKELKVLSLRGMCEAVTYYVEKEEKKSILQMVNHQISETCKFLNEQNDISSEVAIIQNLVERFKEIRSEQSAEDEIHAARQHLDGHNVRSISPTMDDLVDNVRAESTSSRCSSSVQNLPTHVVSDSDDDNDISIVFPIEDDKSSKPARGRGRGRARGRASTGKASLSTSARGGKKSNNDSTSFFSNVTSSSSRGNKQGTMLSFCTGSRSTVGSAVRSGKSTMGATMFDDIVSSPNKKAKIEYESDDD